MTKPRIFLGSSSRALPVAYAIKANLEDVAQVEVWDEPGVFELGEQFMTSLSQALAKYDFAIIVIAPDDTVLTDGEDAKKVTRDNVLVELGLFVGGLGRDRTLLVCDSDPELTIPDDIKGIKFASYTKPKDGVALKEALKPACAEITDAIARRGRAATLRQVQEMVQRLAKYSMSSSIFDHLAGIAILRDYKLPYSSVNERELNFLRDNGLIRPQQGDFPDFSPGWAGWGENLVRWLNTTPTGMDAVKIRRDDIKKWWLDESHRHNLREDPAQWT